MARSDPADHARRGSGAGPARPEGGSRLGLAGWCERASLAVLLVVLAIRPLIAETYDSAVVGISRVLPGIGHPTPAVTVLIDLAILIAVLLWVVGSALRAGRSCRWGMMELGALVAAAAAIVSCAAASNKRLAIVATGDWVAMVAVMILLARQVRRPWQARLVLCVVLASGLTSAVKCIQQRAYEFDETIREYRRHEAALWLQEGLRLDDPQVELYRRRLYGKEATGFFVDPNVAGSYLVLCAFAAAGLAAAKLRGPVRPFRRAFGVVGVGLTGVGLVAVGLTASRGAILAVILGAGVWLGLERLKGRLGPVRRRMLVVGWLAAATGAAAVVGYGTVTGTLPTDSLRFRWGYWQASARMIAEHPWTGVGTANFGRAYTRYKSIRQPEEVKDPHNLLVKAAAEWGLVGAVGLVVMLVGLSSRIVGDAPVPDPYGRADCRPFDTPGRPLRWTALVAVAAFAAHALAGGYGSFAGLVVGTLIPAGIWLIAINLLLLDSDQMRFFEDDALPGCTLAVACGLLVFVVLNLITFSLFVPGAGTTFFALAGLACSQGLRQHEAVRRSAAGQTAGESVDRLRWGRRWAPAGSLAAATAAYAAFVCRPVVLANVMLERARERFELRGQVDSAGGFRAWASASAGGLRMAVTGAIDARAGLASGTLQAGQPQSARPAAWSARRLGPGRTAEGSGQAEFYRGSDDGGWLLQFVLDPSGTLTGMVWNLPRCKRLYEAAARMDRLDPTAPGECARALLDEATVTAPSNRPDARTQVLRLYDEAIRWSREAIRRDPCDVGKYRFLAGVWGRRYRVSARVGDLEEAVAAARRAVALYPSLPDGHVALADLLASLAEASGAVAYRSEALEHYRRALRLDEARAPGEIRRFPPRVRARIEAAIRGLTEAGESSGS